ncbi:MAG: hypothetical protein ACRDZ2_04865 [Ilumatobacteraceae bacterium]
MPKLSVTAKKGLLQFLITKPLTVTVDGTEHAIPWGSTSDLDVAPGDHDLYARFLYLGREAGKAVRSVPVGPDGTRVRYKTPLWVTSAGRLTIE